MVVTEGEKSSRNKVFSLPQPRFSRQLPRQREPRMILIPLVCAKHLIKTAYYYNLCKFVNYAYYED